MATRVPILRQGTNLIASIQDQLTDSDLADLQIRILNEVMRTSARGLVIDVGSLEVLDSYGTRMLSNMVAAVQLRSATTVIVGIQPKVALSMVLLGLTLPDVPTALDLDAGLRYLEKQSAVP